METKANERPNPPKDNHISKSDEAYESTSADDSMLLDYESSVGLASTLNSDNITWDFISSSGTQSTRDSYPDVIRSTHRSSKSENFIIDGYRRRVVNVYNHHARSDYDKDAPHPSYSTASLAGSTASFIVKGIGKRKTRSSSKTKAKVREAKPTQLPLLSHSSVTGVDANEKASKNAVSETQVGGDDGGRMHNMLADSAADEQHKDPMPEEDNPRRTMGNDHDFTRVPQLLVTPIYTARVDHPSITAQNESQYHKDFTSNLKNKVGDVGVVSAMVLSKEFKESGEGSCDGQDWPRPVAELGSCRSKTPLESSAVSSVGEIDLPGPSPWDLLSNETNFLKPETSIRIEPLGIREYSLPPDYSRNTDSHSTESMIDSDLFSISDYSNDLELSLEDRIYLELVSLAIGIVVGDTSAFSGGQSSTWAGAGSAVNSPEYTRASSTFSGSKTTGPSRKRGRTQKSTEESDDEELPQLPSIRASNNTGGDRTRSLACPFAKMDPVKHLTCFSRRLTRVRDVKQHLYRKHTPEFYCNRCKAQFPNDASLQEHVGNAEGLFCEPSTWLDGISAAQRQRLSRKSDPRLSVEDQWYSMWDIIFPGHYNRPSSVYVVFGFSDDLCSYREFSTSRMADSVVEGLQDSGFDAPNRAWDDVRRIIVDRVDSSFDQWLSNRFTTSMPSSDTSSSILQTSTRVTGQGTPSSSQSSRMSPRYQSRVDGSRNGSRLGAEAAAQQQGAFGNIEQADNTTPESPSGPHQNSGITPLIFEELNLQPSDNTLIDESQESGTLNFDTSFEMETNWNFLFDEHEVGH